MAYPTTIELYRRKAEECRKQADKSFNSQDKESWLCLADDWTKMAEKANDGWTEMASYRNAG